MALVASTGRTPRCDISHREARRGEARQGKARQAGTGTGTNQFTGTLLPLLSPPLASAPPSYTPLQNTLPVIISIGVGTF